MGNDHALVLNKFAIVPEHFLLITNKFERQTALLDPGDLYATYRCIQGYHKDAEEEEGGPGANELFAFFNSGRHSGASQPHRHLQLLPVERMRDGLEEKEKEEGGRAGSGWGPLADRLVAAEGEGPGDKARSPLPFLTFSEKLTGDMDKWALHLAYLRLYDRARSAVGGDAAVSRGEPVCDTVEAHMDTWHTREGEEARISYNLAMTRGAIVICPRLAEGDVVRDGEGREVGSLALNGTVLAGTALVKSQAEWDALRGDGGKQLWRVLGKIGVPAGDRDGQ